MISDLPFDIPSLHAAYRGGLLPQCVIAEVFRRIDEAADPGIFIALETVESLEAQADALGTFDPVAKPLWGIPFAVKDNIDTRGLPTTAACPAFAYQPEVDAFCVAALREAGALMIGKTNLDQFATGLVGTRTPYPQPRNAVDPELVPGGSSSGSAVALSRGLVSFSLGTDTAGSGRVPAAFNNIVGLKPTLGTISMSGLVPACRTLDTISIFALNIDDAYAAYQCANRFDTSDAFAREFPAHAPGAMPESFRVGIPDERTRKFYGDSAQEASFAETLTELEALGATLIPIDFQPLFDIAERLYAGSWVAERFTVIETLLKENPDAVHPVTRAVIEPAENLSASDAFRDFYTVSDIKAAFRPVLAGLDMLCVPTVPALYKVSDLAEDPITPNSFLGTYTNFVNLMDFCGLAVPVAPRRDGRPGSITLLATAGKDGFLAVIGRSLHHRAGVTAGATGWPLPDKREAGSLPLADEIELAVVGAHMSGLPLNKELTRLNARFLRKTRTAEGYKLYALAGGPPMRPGLMRDPDGASIELETWALPAEKFGAFIAGVPQPLGIGTLTLETGETVKGFICEAAGLDGAQDITAFGSWRNFLASQDD